jgi:hypothetical protein
MNQLKRYLLLPVILILLSSSLIVACSQSEQKPVPPAPVSPPNQEGSSPVVPTPAPAPPPEPDLEAEQPVPESEAKPTPTPSTSPYSLTPSVPQIETLTYTNPEYGFSVDYPAAWEVKEGWRDSVVTFKGPMVLEGAGYELHATTLIAIEQLRRDMTLQDYVMAIEADQQTSLLKSTYYRSTMGGVPAIVGEWTIDVNMENEKIRLKDLVVIFIKDNVGYVIAYDIPLEFHDNYLKAFSMALRTFKFN